MKEKKSKKKVSTATAEVELVPVFSAPNVESFAYNVKLNRISEVEKKIYIHGVVLGATKPHMLTPFAEYSVTGDIKAKVTVEVNGINFKGELTSPLAARKNEYTVTFKR